ncbi:MAG: hypothetical protein M0013_08290 [Actinomycetota bacterium]|nr:hypothetical protein [Actinomycetota bacterium]
MYVGPAFRDPALRDPVYVGPALRDLFADRRRTLARFLQRGHLGHLVDPASPHSAVRQSGHHPGWDARRALADHRQCG